MVSSDNSLSEQPTSAVEDQVFDGVIKEEVPVITYKSKSKQLSTIIKLIIFFILVIIPIIAFSAEKDYQYKWCVAAGGAVPNIALSDGSFPDCITDDYAIEFDFGHKWAESIGQSLNYAMYTGRRSAIVLIIESNSDENGVKRARKIISHYGLPIDILGVLRPDYIGR